MNLQKLLLLTALLTLIGACSKTTEDEGADHPWETQTQALEKAKGVEQIMQDAADLNRQTIDEQE